MVINHINGCRQWCFMMMEAVLSVLSTDNWINALREEFDISVRVLDFMNSEEGERNLVEIVLRGPGTMEDVVAYAKTLPMLSSFEIDSQQGKRALAVTMSNSSHCCRIIEDAECFLISASTAPDNWIDWMVIFTERASLQTILSQLEDEGYKVKLKKISNIDETKMLTPKQEEAIRTAYLRGYYDIPQRVSIKELAVAFKTSVGTMSQTLRRGQKKIIERYLDLRDA